MECEHILPIQATLMHWWAYKGASDPVQAAPDIRLEYDWSHRCCNQVKSDWVFIYYDPSTQRYIPNDRCIKYVLTIIKNKAKQFSMENYLSYLP